MSSVFKRKTSFVVGRTQLQPLPIRGLFYRWGVDFAGPMLESTRKNQYVMICIKHFTKWVELIPLPDKSSKSAVHALLTNVLSRFGAPGEIITDQGAEFEGAFTDLLVGHRVTHRTTDREHPQSNGFAERMV